MPNGPPVADLRRATLPLSVYSCLPVVRPCPALFGAGRVHVVDTVASHASAVGYAHGNTSSDPPTLRRPPPGGVPDQNPPPGSGDRGTGRPAPALFTFFPDTAVSVARRMRASALGFRCRSEWSHDEVEAGHYRLQPMAYRPPNTAEHCQTTLDTGFPSVPSSAQRRMLFATTIR